MNNFEERHTAWVDGAMDPAERARFEAELPDAEAARAEADRWRRMKAAMRDALAPTAMPHADFLNHQVLAEIERSAPAAREERAPVRWLFPAGRLAWLGAFLLMLAAGLSFLLLPKNGGLPSEAQFISQVVDARSADPKLGAYAFAAPGGKGAVLWVMDAGFIPADEKIK